MKTKIGFWIPAILFAISTVFLTNCTKDDDVDATIPVVSTNDVTDVTPTTAKSGGSVSSDGGATIIKRGVCWSTSENPTVDDEKTEDGTGKSSFESSITDLTPNTTYHVRAYATNSKGATGYGSVMSFTTEQAGFPIITTSEPTGITSKTATSGGNITDNGGAPIITRGVCWGTSANPTVNDNKTEDGTGMGIFISNITNLSPNTTYHVRAYATNNMGTGYGSSMSFTTVKDLTDIDGNTYETVVIGDQTWMAKNLVVTKYNDGTSIPNVTDDAEWGALTTGALCDYDNTPSNSETYGKLYNWYAVNTGKLCPTGWHVPNDDDWNTLENYLIANGYNYDGTTTDNKIAKALASPDGWPSATVEGSIGNNDYPHKQNVSGFSALPGGYRYSSGTYDAIGTRGFWWSATETAEDKANGRRMYNDYIHLRTLDSFKTLGWSVRCVRD